MTFGQTLPVQRETIYLRKLSDSLQNDYLAGRKLAVEWARKNNIPLKQYFAGDRFIELQYMDEFSLPVFYETRNTGAARTTSASSLHPGGALRMFITGKGMIAGVWDGGRVEPGHDELSARVVPKDVSVPSNHATHVGGTIIAKGVSSNAKGMAPDAVVHSYDWTSDLAEMAAEAADGLLLSNHSYGIVLGWRWEDDKWRWYAHPDSLYDYRFGYYSGKSSALDAIAFNAPYYLISWAAGNDRNDGGDGTKPPDGPYDCIGPESIAKNVLAVGAVRKIATSYNSPSDVVMSEFSSWGPADDGRIKPDIVGAGVQLFSSVTGNSYAVYSGTSMAAPNVTGSLLLLQQLNREMHGEYLKAATLKGLVIHTARYAGSSKGPDYQFGWGLMSTDRSAGMILYRDDTDFLIKELSLSEEEEFTMEFEANGTGDIIATISWTDPPANPVAPNLSKTSLMLVNDLDLRIYNEAGDVVYLPWILDPLSPVSSAVKGDNFRDNVEKILIENPPAGRYLLKITHKGVLVNEKQDFSLILQTRDIPQKKNFHWIGGSGNWSEPANWSLSSGGISAGEIPGIEDHVVFDGNSFPGAATEYIVNIDSDAECFTFNWLADKNVRLETDNQEIKVFSSVYLMKDHKMQLDNLKLKLTGDLPNNQILDYGNAFQGGVIEINGSGTWNIPSDLNVSKLVLESGNLIASGVTIKCDTLLVMNNYSGLLDISSSKFDGLHILNFLSENFELKSENSRLIFNSLAAENDPAKLISSLRDFQEVTNERSEMILFGSNNYKNFINYGHVFIEQGNYFRNLKLLPGSIFEPDENTTQVIQEAFIIQSSSDSIVTLKSKGPGEAFLQVVKYNKFCFDFIDISGVSVSGPGVFSAGLNSFVDPLSQGWLQKECNEILFADFEVKFPCTKSLINFLDRSQGVVERWRWQIDYNETIIESSRKDTIAVFTEEGILTVSLTVANDDQEETISRQIQIIQNTLEPGEIVVTGASYFSAVQASTYQWYLNGAPIPFAIFRTFDNVNNLQGVIQVLISDGVCNILSNSVVTSVNNPSEPENSIRVYPNPASSQVFIELAPGNVSVARTTVEIADLGGRVMLKRNFEPWETNLEIGTTLLKPGMYILRVRNDAMSHAVKLVIH